MKMKTSSELNSLAFEDNTIPDEEFKQITNELEGFKNALNKITTDEKFNLGELKNEIYSNKTLINIISKNNKPRQESGSC